MGALSPWHWAVVIVAVVILFGSRKLPDAARGLGQSLRIFKSEVKEMQKDGKTEEQAEGPQRELPPSDPSATTPTVPTTDDVKKSA